VLELRQLDKKGLERNEGKSERISKPVARAVECGRKRNSRESGMAVNFRQTPYGIMTLRLPTDPISQRTLDLSILSAEEGRAIYVMGTKEIIRIRENRHVWNIDHFLRSHEE
jgi:hypothetical protein